MSTRILGQAGRLGTPAEGGRLRLSLIATARPMIVPDDTVANIAPPGIQRAPDVPAAVLPWIINGYVLAFGALLLPGDRPGDLDAGRPPAPDGSG